MVRRLDASVITRDKGATWKPFDRSEGPEDANAQGIIGSASDVTRLPDGRQRTLAAARALVVCGCLGTSASATVGGNGITATSTRQAGYVVTGLSLHTVAAGWTQPVVSCSSTSSYARIQVGLSSTHGRIVVGTAFNCIHGRAVGYLEGDVFGHRHVFPGDHMSLTMDYFRGSSEVEISDDTQGWGQGADGDGTGGPPMTHASFVVRSKTDSRGSLPLSNFHHAVFDTCTVGGDSLDVRQPERLRMMTGDGELQAVPGAVTTAGDFTVTWKHR